MIWMGKKIVDLSRAFLDTNGAKSVTKVYVRTPIFENFFEANTDNLSVKEKWLQTVCDLNVASQKGLVVMFDAMIGV